MTQISRDLNLTHKYYLYDTSVYSDYVTCHLSIFTILSEHFLLFTM